MISRLKINNYALIRNLDITFYRNLNTITGETGAGKSILMGALGLILGERADTQALLSKESKCVIEGTFIIGDYNLQHFFTANDLDYDNETIIRREISEAGKSRAFINDTPVNLTLLKELGARLVDIHSQHETMELNNREFQLEVVDVYSGAEKVLAPYRKKYTVYQQLQKELAALETQEQLARRDQDYKQFLLNELDEASLQAGEQDEVEKELDTLNNAEHIQQSLFNAIQLLREDEQSVVNRLQEVRSSLQQVAKFNKRIEELFKRVDSNLIDLKDIAAEAEDCSSGIQGDKERQEILSSRLSVIFNLQKKHHCNTVDELLQLRNSLNSELGTIGSMQDQINNLRLDIAHQQKELQADAEKISNQRKSKIPDLEKQINSLLAKVGMPHAAVKVQQDIAAPTAFGSNGIDTITLLFASNKGSTFQPMSRIASGGELSRLMLCIKTVIAGLTALPTLIFDEIDTGISGETARKVGDVMKQLSGKHQLLCITHLPQIAAKANHHFYVYKEAGKNSTSSNIRELNADERVEEIAKMLSGAKPTESALANARELVASN